MAPKISIVIPAYNEANRLVNSIRKVVTYLNDEWPGAELILVDDGSSDNTAQVAEQKPVDAGRADQVIRKTQPRQRAIRCTDCSQPTAILVFPTPTSTQSLIPQVVEVSSKATAIWRWARGARSQSLA